MLSNLNMMHIQKKTFRFEQFSIQTHSKITLELPYFSLELLIASIDKRSVVITLTVYVQKMSQSIFSENSYPLRVILSFWLASSSVEQMAQPISDRTSFIMFSS
jgi:hypothetical protein